VIKQSRFVTTVTHAGTEEDAKGFVRRIREEFPDAGHTCWAYVVGPPGSTMAVGMSDDGEPRGTAGKPMLSVLTNCGVGDIAATVTRYWGGVKLGKGGLVRAYSGGVQQALREVPLAEFVRRVTLRVVIDYGAVTPFQRMLLEHEVDVVSEAFGEKAVYELALPDTYEDRFRTSVVDLTNGQAVICRTGCPSAEDT
jgi:uncharacterized YigZ family protein